MTRHFLRDDDLSPAEQAEILDLAASLKQDRFSSKVFVGPQTVALIFDKPSTIEPEFLSRLGSQSLGEHRLLLTRQLVN